MSVLKLLLDENLSPRLVSCLQQDFELTHVSQVGLRGASDDQVWDYAKANGFAIVSKDSDMHQRSFMHGWPPKVVWIRSGNSSTDDIKTLLVSGVEVIAGFLQDEIAAVLVLPAGVHIL